MKLKEPQFDVYLKLLLKDKNGKIKYRWSGKAHSWVENFYCFMFHQATSCAVYETVFGTEMYSITGVKRSSSVGGCYCWSDTPWTTSIGGIVVGTGTAAEDKTDYALGARIADGSSSGQFTHGTLQKQHTTTGTVHSGILTRLFTNDSGATITVGETGLYGHLKAGGTLDNFMLNRDKLDTVVDVADTETLEVVYTIQLDFTA